MIEYVEVKSNDNILRGMVNIGTAKTPIIMVHGFFSSNRIGPYRLYFQIAERLNAMGYTVFRFDLSGMGESDGDSDYIEFDNHIEDLNNIIHYVCKRCHTESVHLLAHCIGCCTATESAITCDNLVRTVTFISPFMPTDANYRILIGTDAFDQLAHANTFNRKTMICQKSYIDAGSVITTPRKIDLIRKKDLFVLVSGADEFSSLNDYETWLRKHTISNYIIPGANHNYLDAGTREILFSHLEERYATYLPQMVCKESSDSTTFFFVRHAESQKNQKDITGGPGEALTENGVSQIENLYRSAFLQIPHSELEIRTNKIIQVHQTAQLLSQKLNLPYTIDEKLKPAHMGIISGRSRAYVRENHPEISERMTRWRNGEIEAVELNIPCMKDPVEYWNEMVEYVHSLCDGKAKVIVCSRSIMVWVHNFVHNHSPYLGGAYKHVQVNNCDMISFTIDHRTGNVALISEYTSPTLQ